MSAMYLPLEMHIGLRYTRSKRRNHFISFISAASMAGIFLGVAALIVVLSVMNGFEKELRERILGMASHATVSELSGRLSDWPAVARRLEDMPHVLAVAPYVQVEAMLTNGRMVSGALTRGVLPDLEDEVADVGQHMKQGSLAALRPGGFGIVLGAELARALGVGLGDKVTVITPQAGVDPKEAAAAVAVHETISPEETERLGAALARELGPGEIIGLTGDLGAGKTCFVRGLAAGLGLRAHVKSPSFTLLNIYGSGALVLYHMDLYRLRSEDDFFESGLEEYIYSGGVSVIEWADKFPGLLERCALVVRFFYLDDGRRRIVVEDRRGFRSGVKRRDSAG